MMEAHHTFALGAGTFGRYWRHGLPLPLSFGQWAIAHRLFEGADAWRELWRGNRQYGEDRPQCFHAWTIHNIHGHPITILAFEQVESAPVQGNLYLGRLSMYCRPQVRDRRLESRLLEIASPVLHALAQEEAGRFIARPAYFYRTDAQTLSWLREHRMPAVLMEEGPRMLNSVARSHAIRTGLATRLAS